MPQPVKQEDGSHFHFTMLPEGRSQGPLPTQHKQNQQKHHQSQSTSQRIKQDPNRFPTTRPTNHTKKLTKLTKEIAHIRRKLAVERTRHSTLTEYTTKAVKDASVASTKAVEHTKALTTRVDRLRNELSQTHRELSVVKRDYKILDRVTEGLKRDLRAEKRRAEENEVGEQRVEEALQELEEERQRCEILEKRLRHERAKRKDDKLALEKVMDLVGTRVIKIW
ncbi:hypothetical protein CFE70_003337 [Pyrenophora teres f. teres 0-1]|uniref:Uncharacterized protein n=1 Tax=Pyrenophora teres f. teres (strain 0-1) TaxID=861557 RepID=E3SA14_PYRTT|nr:hypothetical protein PTT_19925 [Pyrenophora teres f. teres 0-1]